MSAGKKPPKVAVVLFNLGAPDSLEAVQPFLFNLFDDPAIIRLPNPFRFLLAKLIAKRRAPVAAKIYQELGGKSPLLENTERQARALESALKGKFEARVFIAMRYWHPFAAETACQVKAFGPDRVVLLPLYPQFSTTTTGSSLADWNRAARAAGIASETAAVCCYPRDQAFIGAHVEAIVPYLAKALARGKTRVLFTAHGLPEKVVKAGDPYQWQVEETVERIAAGLGASPKLKRAGWQHVVCYQSRVGPLKWIGPSTEEEIVRGARENMNLVVVPVAFVSEHSETLVELDIEYRELAEREGAPGFFRVPALGTHRLYVESLARPVGRAAGRGGTASGEGGRICPGAFSQCPCRRGAEG